MPTTTASLPTVDLFAGAGGFSTGLARCGFEPILAVESDAEACETYLALHPDAELEPAPIEELSFRDLRGCVALVAAGPPCQPFSTGGKRLADDDPRDGFPELLRVLDEIRPDACLIENVAGLAGPATSGYLRRLLDDLVDRGFTVTAAVLNAADYGVPQKRRRLFIAGLRGGREFIFPRRTHGPGRRWPWRASGSVIGLEHFGEPNPSIVTFAKRPDVRPSPYDGHLFNGGGRAVDLAGPAPTILATAGGNKTPFVDTLGVVPEYHARLVAGGRPRQGRVSGARRLTVEECAALQTFPSGTRFAGARSTRYTHVGNAVPPDLAEKIGRGLAAELDAQQLEDEELVA
ncbi:MAG: DNA cytosine methyltransferase [Actinomycetota bacterium]|nr:DNA cytosine methyltransferase [Actinomycetota bacterium]